jgi:MFS family permease
MATVAASSRINRIPLSRTQAIFLALLVVSICINYIDRGSLSVADKLLKSEFHWDDEQLGRIFSAFFWSYALCQLFSGWLLERFGVNRVLAAGFLVWSTAMLFTGAATGFAMLFGLRLLLGIGESVAYPSYSKILAANFQENQRGFANAAIDAGSKVGPAMGVLVGGLFMGRYGWRVFCFVTGGLSLIWLIPWFALAPKDRAVSVKRAAHVPGLLKIIGKRSAWGTFLGLFCGNYAWYFMLTWLPSYFRNELHYDQSQMSLLASLPFFIAGGSSLLFGYVSDHWISSGASPNRVRKTFTGLGLTLPTVMMGAVITKDPTASLFFVCLAAFFYGLYSSNLWAITQTLAGPTAAGRWTGFQNFIGNLSGIAAPWLTGAIVKATHHFYGAFAVTSALLLVGAFSFTTIIRKVEPETWT